MGNINKGLKCLALSRRDMIPLLKEPLQIAVPKPLQWSRDQRILIDMKMKEILEKGTIAQVSHRKGEFLSHTFLVGKKDGGNRPVINLKNFNEFVPCQHFKMESLNCLKFYCKNTVTYAKSI